MTHGAAFSGPIDLAYPVRFSETYERSGLARAQVQTEIVLVAERWLEARGYGFFSPLIQSLSSKYAAFGIGLS